MPTTATTTHPAAAERWRSERSALVRGALAPPPRLTVSEWADRYRYLAQSSAEPGPWRTARVPYLREIMDAMGERGVHRVVVMKSAQVGATEGIIGNTIGYHIHQRPTPILVVQPTLDDAEKWSKEKLSPMLHESPALQGRVADARSRDSGNTILAKALALDTPLPTPTGWTTVGEVQIGDALFDERGRPCQVTDLTPIFADHLCYRVRFSDGEEVVADAGHRWAVERWVVKKKPRPHQEVVQEVVTTADMAGRVRNGTRFRYAVRMQEPLELPEAALPADPYALGLWLGDGFSHRAVLAMHPDDAIEIVGHLRARGLDASVGRMPEPNVCDLLLEPRAERGRDARTGRMLPVTTGFRSALRELDLLTRSGGGTRKTIPNAYLRASRRQRIALLQGLMDTDGSIRAGDGWCTFTTAIPGIGDTFGELLSTLGIKWTVRKHQSTAVLPGGERRRGAQACTFGFQSPSWPVFRLQRKRERQRPPTTGATRRRIVAIEPVATVPVRCVSVSSDSHLFLAGRRMVPTHNSYPGGFLGITGANSPRGLRQRSVRVVLCDEVDGYDDSAGPEGDPVTLAEKRTISFRDAKILLNSTPTIKGASRIEKAFKESDQRHYYVPCPHCNHRQILRWGGKDSAHGIKWDREEVDGVIIDRPETAAYLCEGCGALIEERYKAWMVSRGEWRAHNPGHPTRGYHLNALVSPFPGARWAALVREWLEAQRDQERLKAFVNTVLGETWEERHDTPTPEMLEGRREAYAAEVPAGVGVLTAGVDVQADRLELLVVGWGEEEESWMIAHHRIHGDPETGDVWARLDTLLAKPYQHASGASLRIRACAVDSGYATEDVYKFVRPREARGVYATKGMDSRAAELLKRSSKPNKYGVKPWTINTVAFKDTLFRRLYQQRLGPGYMHFCQAQADGADAEFFAQFGAEVPVTKTEGGRMVRTYKRIRPRNEAIDLNVMARAALHMLGAGVVNHLGALAKQVSESGDRWREAYESAGRKRGRRILSKGIG